MPGMANFLINFDGVRFASFLPVRETLFVEIVSVQIATH